MKRRLMILLVLSVLTIGSYATIAAAQADQTENRITITATDIAFDRDVIEVAVGQPVELTLINDGALDHDFSIAAIPLAGVASETETGQPSAAAMPCGATVEEMPLTCPYAEEGAAAHRSMMGSFLGEGPLTSAMSRMTAAMRAVMADLWPAGFWPGSQMMGDGNGHMNGDGHMTDSGHMNSDGHMTDGDHMSGYMNGSGDMSGHMNGSGHMSGHMMDGAAGEPQLHVYAAPRSSASVTFTPTEPGEYTFICSVPGHANAGMIGTLVVR